MSEKKRGKLFCAVQNCTNFYSAAGGISFFRFPTDLERSKLWAKACGRHDLLSKDPKTLSANYRVCSSHFEDKMFLNDLKNRLHKHAIPVSQFLEELNPDITPDETCTAPVEEKLISLPQKRKLASSCSLELLKRSKSETIIETNILSTSRESTSTVTPFTSTATSPINSPTSTLETQTSTSLTIHTPRKDKLRQTVRNLRLQVRRLTNKCENLSKFTIDNVTEEQFEQLLDRFLPEDVSKFVKVQYHQHNKKPRGRRYTNEFKQFCLSVYFQGPAAYRTLRKRFYLPTKRSLQRYIECIRFKCGLDDKIFNSLKIKVQHFNPLDKYCSLCIDEMSLKANLFYNISRDAVIGYEDLGQQKSYVPACHVAVIMIRGIQHNWKQPIAYFLVHTTWSATKMKPIILECIKKLKDIGLYVKALISDMGSNFINLSNILGVSSHDPYFYVDNEKINYIFDTPHLIKATRNNLMKYSYTFNSKSTSWGYIKRFYEADNKLQCRLAPKLSNSHIYPSCFERMKVKYATQVLSATVAAAINTYVALGALPAEAIWTAECIDRFNKLFDVLNSSILYNPNKFNRAFSGQSFQIEFLEEVQDYLNKIQIMSSSGVNVTGKIKSIRCWKITISGVISLWHDLHSNGYQFLFTRRINQDGLENFFGIARQQSGNAYNPTPIQFYNAFRKTFCINFLQAGTGNCAADFDDVLSEISNFSDPYVAECSEEDVSIQMDISLPDYDYRNEDLPIQNSLKYICGYLIKKCLCVHSCIICEVYAKSQKDLDSANLYSHFRAYETSSGGVFGNLCMPGDNFVTYIHNLEQWFFLNFEHVTTNNDVVKTLITNITNKFQFTHPCDKFPHKYLIKLYCRMRLFYALIFINRNIKSNKGKRKQIILQHL